MKVLQIGVGSMGKRRLRALLQRSEVETAIFDQRADRGGSVAALFHIRAFTEMEQALEWGPQVLVISTPPDRHADYIRLALDLGLHHFCEEHVWTYDFREVDRISEQKGLVSASSCSAHFLPLVRKVKEIVATKLGDLQAYQMLLSTWAPSWHPQEGPEFYGRHRQTAPAREMVPFELLYLNHIFGRPVSVTGVVSRRGRLAMDSEDIWSLQMVLENGAHAQLSVLMACPSGVRRGFCLGTCGSAAFDVFTGEVRLALDGTPEVTIHCGPQVDVIEKAYDEETNQFVDCVLGRSASWPVSYYDSSVATGTLAAAEISWRTGGRVAVDPTFQPALLPDAYEIQPRAGDGL